MTIRQSGAAERLLRVLFEGGTVGGLTDAELLQRFVARDEITAEPAFAVLVERHGPLVQRVCRSVLRDEHAAEDAFQSTFLVLVKKAASLQVQASLGPWLHAVAYRVACEARSIAARRLKHERKVVEMAARANGVERGARADLELHLHEEIQKLAERHRRPIVLCDLEGLTHEQAARLLGTPVGTIKSRLARGRALLRHRLSRRDSALSGGMLNAVLAPDAFRAEVLGAAVDHTARTAMLVARRGPLIAGAVPASVGILVQGVLNSMFRSKLKMVAMAVFLTASLAISVGFAALSLLARAEPMAQVDQPAREMKQRTSANLVGHVGLIRSAAFLPGGRELISAAAPSNERNRPGEIRTWDGLTAETLRTLTLDGDPFAMAAAPDGKTLAVAIARGDAGDRSLIVRILALPFGEVRLWHFGSGRLLTTLTEADQAIVSVAFSPDDKTVASGGTIWREGKVFGGAVSLWEVATGKKRMTLPAFPSYVHAVSYAPAGALLATAGIGPNGEGQVVLWDTNTWKALKTLTLGKSGQGVTAVKCLVFSGDGKSLAAGGALGNLVLWPVDSGD